MDIETIKVILKKSSKISAIPWLGFAGFEIPKIAYKKLIIENRQIFIVVP